MKLSSKELKIISAALAVWAITLIGLGKVMDNDDNVIVKKTYSINITKKQASTPQQKTIDLELKDIEIEYNTPLSTDVKDYIENNEMFSEIQLKQLFDTLDTSEVNITEPGTYKYTITYKKKKKAGSITVKEKETPNVTFTLKRIRMPISGTISRNVKDYINETLDSEVYKNMILDLSDVVEHETIAGKYKYSITYKGTVYYGDYEIWLPVITTSNHVCPDNANYDDMRKTCVCKNKEYYYDLTTKECTKK